MKLGSRMSWKHASWIIATFLFYWFFLKKKPYPVVIHRTITGVEPQKVWEYVSDFSHYKTLNPTVDDFQLEYEKGNYAGWEYGLTVKEHLVQLPSIPVLIQSVYIVTPAKDGKPYTISSYHSSCVFGYCVGTNATMTFIPRNNGKSTEVTESLLVECPPILNSFCISDLHKQKKLIFDNLEVADFSVIN